MVNMPEQSDGYPIASKMAFKTWLWFGVVSTVSIWRPWVLTIDISLWSGPNNQVLSECNLQRQNWGAWKHITGMLVKLGRKFDNWENVSNRFHLLYLHQCQRVIKRYWVTLLCFRHMTVYLLEYCRRSAGTLEVKDVSFITQDYYLTLNYLSCSAKLDAQTLVSALSLQHDLLCFLLVIIILLTAPSFLSWA